MNNKEYSISTLQWSIGDYTSVSQFIVKSLWSSNGDLVLGLPWVKTLENFILNAEKKFLTLPYKNKKITFLDINMKTESEVASS